MLIIGNGEGDLPYNPRYSTMHQTGQGSTGLATIPEDEPPPSNVDPVAFSGGLRKDESDSLSISKESSKSRTYCGK